MQETTALIPAGASAAQVEGALTALTGVGAGGVEVTGPAGGPYAVTFKGVFAYQPVRLMGASGSVQASVSELTRGRADGEIAVTAENLGDASVNGEAALVKLSDTLPTGLAAVGIVGIEPGAEANYRLRGPDLMFPDVIVVHVQRCACAL